MASKFRGGVHPHDHKEATNKKSIEKVKAPDYVYLPMRMHIGAPSVPCVSVGDEVRIGQKIADKQGAFSACIHATVSGTIDSISPRLTSSGDKVETIVIKNDFKNNLATDLPRYNYEEMTGAEIVDAIADSGIVGHGGAAFPTHIKISSALGKIDTIIVNAAECEPFITSDHRLLIEQPDKLIQGLKILERVFGISKILIGIEKNKKDTFGFIETAITNASSPAKIVPLPTRYPQGSEKQLIYALTKREVKSGALPADAHVVMFNVDTVIAIATLFEKGLPMVRRIVTVSGSAIANPKNLETPIGTLVSHIVDNAGGLKIEPNKLIMGGPMMGQSQYTLDIPVIKGTNAFLALGKDEDKRAKDPACIRCGKCETVCPMGLVPVFMNMYAEHDMYDEYEKIGGLDCIACGCCSYECPARIELVQQFKNTKTSILANKKK